jgi:DNA-binding MarR family transcriptional regulator
MAMTGSLTAGRRAQIVARVVELRPEVLALMRESAPEELDAGFGHVTGRQLQVLTHLPADGLTMGEVATFLRVSGAAASVLADRLVSQDLAVRHADPADRRVVRLVPTPQGAALAERYREYQRRGVAALLDRLSDAQVVAWLDVMETLASSREETAAAALAGAAAPAGAAR